MCVHVHVAVCVCLSLYGCVCVFIAITVVRSLVFATFQFIWRCQRRQRPVALQIIIYIVFIIFLLMIVCSPFDCPLCMATVYTYVSVCVCKIFYANGTVVVVCRFHPHTLFSKTRSFLLLLLMLPWELSCAAENSFENTLNLDKQKHKQLALVFAVIILAY